MTRFRNHFNFVLFSLLAVGGCSLTGTWKTIETAPPEATGVIRTITFKERSFTATTDEGIDIRTSTGTYKWNGSRLTLRTADDLACVLSGRKSFGDKLTLVDKRPDGPVRTILYKVSD